MYLCACSYFVFVCIVLSTYISAWVHIKETHKYINFNLRRPPRLAETSTVTELIDLFLYCERAERMQKREGGGARRGGSQVAGLLGGGGEDGGRGAGQQQEGGKSR